MSDFTVLAVRYCTDVPATVAFYETLGLTRRVSTAGDGFVSLIAGDGLLMLHPAATAITGVAPGWAALSLEVSHLDAAADALQAAGIDAVRWDESYGRHLGIRDPRGDGIWITETQHDLYGYRGHAAAANDMNLLAVRFSTDFAADAAFFSRFGFAPRPGASEHWTALEGLAPARGVIGLHPPGDALPAGPLAPDDPVAPAALVDVSFETHEPLDAVQARLSAAGIDTEFEAGPAPNVAVRDPEGSIVEIHIRP
jgi:catechol 2,3-dioxygenase-like lactoylglutathione lyase family enzyme